MDKLRRMLGGREADPETGTSDATGILSGSSTQDNSGDDLDCFGSLSWTNRLTGFGLCFGVGVVFVIFAFFLLFVFISLSMFAIFYSFGTLFILFSTLFLMGPMKQLRRMFDAQRLVATLVMLGCLVLTLVFALWLKITWLAFIFCIVQMLAMAWYCLSYIPFAREAISGALRNVIA